MNGEYITVDTARLAAIITEAVSKAVALHLPNLIAQTHESSCTPLTMTVEETTKALGLSKPIVYELTKQPDFPCFTMGKKILVNRARLQEWIDQRTNKEVLH